MNATRNRSNRTLQWRLAWSIMAGAALSLMACTTVGSGSGTARPDGTPVVFHWTSKDGGTTGNMTAKLGNGSAFSGPFVQLTNSVRVDVLEPMWLGWRRGWNDWPYWGGRGAFPDTAFATHYSGKVVANLQGPDNQRMRCRFYLNSPQTGMSGGGQGECQLGNGTTVDAVFDKS